MANANEKSAPVQMLDSLSAYEFQVEIDGQVISGVFGVHGLTSYTAEGERPPLLITKMVQRDPNTPTNRWIQETQQATQNPTRDVTIVAMDEGTATRRWTYQQAYITQISYSDFNTALSELVEEQITIRAAAVKEDWI